MQLGEARKSKETVCDHCDSNFLCGRLKTALTFIEQARKTKSLTDDHIVTIQNILNELQKTGWNFSESQEMCTLAYDKDRVSELTDQLISVIDQNR